MSPPRSTPNLRGRPLPVEIRTGRQAARSLSSPPASAGLRAARDARNGSGDGRASVREQPAGERGAAPSASETTSGRPSRSSRRRERAGAGCRRCASPYGARESLAAGCAAASRPVEIRDDLDLAQAIVTLKNYYRRRRAFDRGRRAAGISIYVAGPTPSPDGRLPVDVFQLYGVDEHDLLASDFMRSSRRSAASAGAADCLTPQARTSAASSTRWRAPARLCSHSYGQEPTAACGSSATSGRPVSALHLQTGVR